MPPENVNNNKGSLLPDDIFADVGVVEVNPATPKAPLQKSVASFAHPPPPPPPLAGIPKRNKPPVAPNKDQPTPDTTLTPHTQQKYKRTKHTKINNTYHKNR